MFGNVCLDSCVRFLEAAVVEAESIAAPKTTMMMLTPTTMTITPKTMVIPPMTLITMTITRKRKDFLAAAAATPKTQMKMLQTWAYSGSQKTNTRH